MLKYPKSQSHTEDLLTHDGASNDNDTEVGVSVKEEREETARLAVPDLHQEPVALDGSDRSSNTEIDVLATGKGKAQVAPEIAMSFHTVTSATGAGDRRTSVGGLNLHRRVLPLVAKPPTLMAAVFPWDRKSEIQVGRASTARTDDTRAAMIGVPLSYSSGDGGVGSLEYEKASSANNGGGKLKEAVAHGGLGVPSPYPDAASTRKGANGVTPERPLFPLMGQWKARLYQSKVNKIPLLMG